MKLEWNVLYYNFNSDKIEKLNIFNSNFINELDEATINDRESLKKYIKDWARYNYWSRAEYEVIVGGLFKNCKKEKIDIYKQIEMNLDRITDYVLAYINKERDYEQL